MNKIEEDMNDINKEMTKQEKDFIEFIRNDSKTSFVIDKHIIKKQQLEDDNRKYLKIKNGLLPLKSNFKELNDDELSLMFSYINLLLLIKDEDEDEDKDDI